MMSLSFSACLLASTFLLAWHRADGSGHASITACGSANEFRPGQYRHYLQEVKEEGGAGNETVDVSHKTITIPDNCKFDLISQKEGFYYAGGRDKVTLVAGKDQVIYLELEWLDAPKMVSAWELNTCTWTWMEYKVCTGAAVKLYNADNTLLHEYCGEHNSHDQKSGTIFNSLEKMTVEFDTRKGVGGQGFLAYVYTKPLDELELYQEPDYESSICEPDFGVGHLFEKKSCYKFKPLVPEPWDVCKGPLKLDLSDSIDGEQIGTPNFDGIHPFSGASEEVDYVWIIKAPEQAVTVQLRALDIGQHYSKHWIGSGMFCSRSYGHIEFHNNEKVWDTFKHSQHRKMEDAYDCNDLDSKSCIINVCGNDSLPERFSTKSNSQLLIILRQRDVYPENGHTGFLATIDKTPEEVRTQDACWFGPEKVFTPRTIESPIHYARAGYYPNNMACQWLVKSPCEQMIKAHVKKLSMWSWWYTDRLVICDSATDYGYQSNRPDFAMERKNQEKYGLTNTLCRQMLWFVGTVEDEFTIPDNVYCHKNMFKALRIENPKTKKRAAGSYSIWEAKTGWVWKDCLTKGKCACNFQAGICRGALLKTWRWYRKGFWWSYLRKEGNFAHNWTDANYMSYCNKQNDNYVWGDTWMIKFESDEQNQAPGFIIDLEFVDDPDSKMKMDRREMDKRELNTEHENDLDMHGEAPEMRAVHNLEEEDYNEDAEHEDW